MCKPVWSLNQDIANVALFAGVAPESLARIVRGGVRRVVEPRERIYWQGETAGSFYVIRAGHVRLAVASPGGDEKVIDILSAGQHFGLAELFGARIHTSFAEAVTAVSLIEIDAGSLFHAIGAHPDLALRILSAVAGQYAALQQDVIASSFRSGTDRLVDYLLALAGRKLRPGYEASIELPVSKRLIAARLGVTAETLSRLLRELSDSGLIRVYGRQITLRPALAARLAGDLDTRPTGGPGAGLHGYPATPAGAPVRLSA
jgi:CRP-like cAMP-binding protein